MHGLTPTRSTRRQGLPDRSGSTSFGHTEVGLQVFIDPDLLQYDEVWAAAGTWHDVFALSPTDLERVSGGTVTDLKRG